MTSPASSQQAGSRSSASGSSERQPTGSTIADALSVEEHGRTFNAYREGKYLLPNDGDEQDRLDLQHHIFTLMLGGKLYLAPIGEPADVLDIGTGTGIWAKLFAQRHPNSRVLGTDISIIQPSENNPPNVTFVREDSEDPWIFDHLFDYIHWRMMCSCFTDFPAMIAKVHEHLHPGGIAEFLDFAFEIVGADAQAEAFYQASSYAKYIRYCITGAATHGKDLQSGRRLKGWMVEAGFEGVVEQQFLVPLSAWPLDPTDRLIGGWAALDWTRFLTGTTKLMVAAGMPLHEVPAFLEQVRLDIISPKMRVYWIMYSVHGRTPGVKVTKGTSEPISAGE